MKVTANIINEPTTPETFNIWQVLSTEGVFTPVDEDQKDPTIFIITVAFSEAIEEKSQPLYSSMCLDSADDLEPVRLACWEDVMFVKLDYKIEINLK